MDRFNRKIKWEGFDYYFCHYGCDEELEKLIGDDLVNKLIDAEDISGYLKIRRKLYDRLIELKIIKHDDKDITGQYLRDFI